VRKSSPLPLFLFLVIQSSYSFASPVVAKSAVIPEPGVLALLGGGLVGLASLIRRHLND
jgi:hypothetical protein